MGFYIDEGGGDAASAPEVPKGFFVEPNATPAPAQQGDGNIEMGMLKGLGRGALDIFAGPADLLYRGGNSLLDSLTGEKTDIKGGYPSERIKQGFDYLSGGEGNQTSEDLTRLGTGLATALAVPSQSENIAAQLPTVAKLSPTLAKYLGVAGEGAAWGAVGDGTSDNLGENAGVGAVINSVLHGGGAAAEKVMSMFKPAEQGAQQAQKIAGDFRSIVPDAFTSTTSAEERANTIAGALEKSGQQAKTDASKLYENLPTEPVVLDDAIAKIKAFGEDGAGYVTPGGKVGSMIRYLESLKPAERLVETDPASSKLNWWGSRTNTPSTIEKVADGPVTLPLNKVQDVLRDIGKQGGSSSGFDAAVFSKAKTAVLDAAQNSVSPEASQALTEARTAWRSMKQTFENSAVGAVREGAKNVEGRGALNTLKTKLLADPKSAEQIMSQLKPNEIGHAQNLVLGDLLAKQPVTWERAISQKYDSYKAIFGEEGAGKLLNMVSREGTIGSKLLKDNNGLKAMLSKLGAKTALGSALGYEADGKRGAVIGMLAGFKSSTKGEALVRAKSILMRAAVGDSKVLQVLNSPAGSKSISNVVDRLAHVLSRSTAEFSESQSDSSKLQQKGIKSQSSSVPLGKTKFINNAMDRAEAKMTTPQNLVHGHNLDAVADAVTAQETGGTKDPVNAVSSTGAVGLMQLMPATGKELADRIGVAYNPRDPEQNRQLGKMYLTDLLNKYDGDLPLALTAYHTGMGNVDKLLKSNNATTLDEILPYLGPVGKKYAKGVLTKLQKQTGAIEV